MAFVAESWSISMMFQDRDKNYSSCAIYYANDVPFTTVETDAAAAVAAIGALSDAPIVTYTIARTFRDNAAPVPPETSDVERKGYFMFRLADGRSTSFSVPSLKNTLVIDNTNVINTTDALVAAVVAAVQSTGTDTIGVAIETLEKAEKRHRRNRKG